MSKFNEKSFNGQAFGKYVDRIPNTKRNELIKSKALKSNEPVSYTHLDVYKRQDKSRVETNYVFRRNWILCVKNQVI